MSETAEHAQPSPRQQATELLHQGKFTDALPLFRQEASVNHNDVWFIHDYSQALTAVGGRDNVTQAIELLQQAVRLDEQNSQPPNEWVQIRLAEAYGRRGMNEQHDYEAARHAYEVAREINPDNPEVQFLNASDWHDEASQLKKTGNQAMEEGDAQKALQMYDKALTLVGEEGEPWSLFDKGKALEAIDQRGEAINAMKEATQLMPHEPWPYADLGGLYERSGDLAQARKYYKMALERDATNGEAVTRLHAIGWSERPDAETKVHGTRYIFTPTFCRLGADDGPRMLTVPTGIKGNSAQKLSLILLNQGRWTQTDLSREDAFLRQGTNHNIVVEQANSDDPRIRFEGGSR